MQAKFHRAQQNQTDCFPDLPSQLQQLSHEAKDLQGGIQDVTTRADQRDMEDVDDDEDRNSQLIRVDEEVGEEGYNQ